MRREHIGLPGTRGRETPLRPAHRTAPGFVGAWARISSRCLSCNSVCAASSVAFVDQQAVAGLQEKPTEGSIISGSISPPGMNVTAILDIFQTQKMPRLLGSRTAPASFFPGSPHASSWSSSASRRRVSRWRDSAMRWLASWMSWADEANWSSSSSSRLSSSKNCAFPEMIERGLLRSW